MKLGNVSLLGVALATALAATACNRTDDTASTYDDKPATTADQPATETTTPAAAPAATNTASTETEPATDAVPATTTAPATATAPAMAPGATLADATTLFDDMDVNKDNGLSQDELPDTHPLRQGFTIADSDGNGMLSRTEVDSYRSKMPPPGG